MSINNGAILKGATLGITGGTSESLIGLSDSDGKTRVFYDGTDYLSRSEIDFTTRAPKVNLNSPDGYTQPRSAIILKTPKVLSNGLRTVGTVRIEFSTSIETTSAEKDEMLNDAAQLLISTEFSSFWKNQSQS
jgi:hypothetical protein